jgi:hypothetical protein
MGEEPIVRGIYPVRKYFLADRASAEEFSGDERELQKGTKWNGAAAVVPDGPHPD